MTKQQLGVTSNFRWLQLQHFAKGGNITFFNLSHYERSNIGTYCFDTMIFAYLDE